MTSKTLSKEQIQALEFQTDQIYESFKRAVDTQNIQDAIWLNGLFSAFDESLHEVTTPFAWVNWKRESLETPIFDKYLLYYAIGHSPSNILEELVQIRQYGHDYPAKETHFTVDNLKQYIDNTKGSYSKIQDVSISLGEAHKFSGIIDALGYVRDKYPSPGKK